MKIAVVGCGYVGLVTGVCLTSWGHEIFCVDVDFNRIEQLRRGKVPFYEPGLEDLLIDGIERGQLHFTTELAEALKLGATVFFLCVGTPMGKDGRADIHEVLNIAASLGSLMEQHLYIVNKSTVPVGTAEQLQKIISSQLLRRGAKLNFDVISNPEFLKEGTAVSDCLNPDRIILGVETPGAQSIMREIYSPFFARGIKVFITDLKSAEMIKYAANAMLATRISFINELANICELTGANINVVKDGIGADPRIGAAGLNPGCGYGGSCFPKDLRALICLAEDHEYTPLLLSAVEKVNQAQKQLLVSKVKAIFGEDLSSHTFAIWGLSFKPNTSDLREAPSITVISELTALGASIRAYDPKAMPEAASLYFKGNLQLTYTENKEQALEGASALLILTEWEEFRRPDFSVIRQKLKTPLIIDGRNLYAADMLSELGFVYCQIGGRNAAVHKQHG